MSSQPEDEVEDGEIVSDEEEEIVLSEEEEEDDEFFMDEDEGVMDVVGLMSSLLATPDGDTVCSALVNISNQLETQNRILIKMLAKMSQKST
jgi:hypothetical protein